MQAKYFADTDTLLLVFSDREICESRNVNEDVLLDLDKDGRVVALTVEHAAHQTSIDEFSFERLSA